MDPSHEGSIHEPSHHERTLLPRSYILLHTLNTVYSRLYGFGQPKCLMHFNHKIKCVKSIVKENISFLPINTFLTIPFFFQTNLKNNFILLCQSDIMPQSIIFSLKHYRPNFALKHITTCIYDNSTICV